MNETSSDSIMQRLLHSKNFWGLIALIAICATFGWDFWQASEAKKEVWEGKIVEAYRTRRWWRGFMGPLESKPYRFYSYYWRIELSTGATITVKLPWSDWGEGKAGDFVRKRYGQRYPHVAATKADSQRRGRDEVASGGSDLPLSLECRVQTLLTSHTFQTSSAGPLYARKFTESLPAEATYRAVNARLRNCAPA